jgi:hypothetical protein
MGQVLAFWDKPCGFWDNFPHCVAGTSLKPGDLSQNADDLSQIKI